MAAAATAAGHLGDHMSSFLDDNMHNAVFRSLDIFPDPVQVTVLSMVLLLSVV